MPLCFELLAQQDTNRYWCGEVNLCRFHGLCLVLPQFFLGTQGAKSYNSNVNIAALKCLVDDSWVRLKISCDKVNNVNVCTLRLQRLHSVGDTWGISPRRERYFGRAVL